MLKFANFKETSQEYEINSLMIPFSNRNGVYVLGSEKSIETQNEIIEYLIIQYLHSYNNVNIDIYNFSNSDSFYNLYNISNKLESIRFHRDKNITDLLNYLEKHLEYIKYNILSNDFISLNEYNKKSDVKESFKLILLNGFPHNWNNENLNRLNDFLYKTNLYGIHFIINHYETQGKKENRYNIGEAKSLLTEISKKLFTVNVKAQSISFNDEFYQEIIDDFGIRLLNYKKINKTLSDEIIARNTINNKKKNIYDFLEISIGKNGRNDHMFSMGEKSKVFGGFIVGGTGMGKSTLNRQIIIKTAEKYSSDNIRLFLVDLKGSEFGVFKELPNVQGLVLNNHKDVITTVHRMLDYLIKEMETRNELFNQLEISKGTMINDIDRFNENSITKIPRILVIVDEAQGLFKGVDIRRESNSRLAELVDKGRSSGIHLIFSAPSYQNIQIDDSIITNAALRIGFRTEKSNASSIMKGNQFEFRNLDTLQLNYNPQLGHEDYNSIVNLSMIEANDVKNRISEAKKKFKDTQPFNQIGFSKGAISSEKDNKANKYSMLNDWDKEGII